MFAVTAGEVRRLGVVRALVGALFVIRTTALLYLVPGLARYHGGPLTGWPSDAGLRLGLFGVVLPIALVKSLCVVRTIAGVLFAVGIRARVAGIVATSSAYVVWSQEPLSFIFTIHTLYLSVLFLALGDGANAFALAPPRRVRSFPSSSVWLIRGLVVSAYAWSAVAKLNGDWLSGRTLAREHAFGYVAGPLADRLLTSTASTSSAAVGTVLIEAALPVLLVAKRTRTAGVVLACIFHAVLESAARPDVFGWLIVVLLATFWPPPRRAT